MTDNNLIIRNETENDYRDCENLMREAFWNVYRPGCSEHYVLHCFRTDPAFVKELDFVAELDGEIIGQVIYVRATIDCADGKKSRSLRSDLSEFCPNTNEKVSARNFSISRSQKPRNSVSAL